MSKRNAAPHVSTAAPFGPPGLLKNSRRWEFFIADPRTVTEGGGVVIVAGRLLDLA